MKAKSIVLLLFIALSISVSGQKIKYKDLFPILNAKNWAEGAPQLRAFLADPKNAEEANAHLQMGLMLEEQFLALDVAADTVTAYGKGDSAVFYLNKAKELITDKELKKNDKYYQSFFRRDLRTGEFGIKQSDVHLDIEKKVEVIDGRMNDSRNLQRQADALESNNEGAIEKYKQITSKYSSYNELLLGADDEAMSLLQELKSASFTSKEAAKEVKKLASNLGTDKYKEEIALKEIENFGVDGTTGSDFTSGKIELWDYEAWVIDTNSELNGSIGLMKSMITNHSETIREKKAKVKKSIDAEIDTLSAELSDLFAKYDPESIAMKLLLTEASEARIIKMVDLSINKPLQDSALVGAQLEIFTTALEEAQKMSLVVESINLGEMNQAKNYYPDYINSFFQTHGTASNYVTEMKTWSNQQKNWLQQSVDYWSERDRWGIFENQVDDGVVEVKIPLFLQESPETQYNTLGIPLKSNEEVLVYGTNLTEGKGYIYSFADNRYMNWNLEFELPGSGDYQLSADTIPSPDGNYNLYFLNSATAENNLSVVSFTTSGQLNWNTTVSVPKAPVDYKFDEITQELTILLYPEEELPLENDELGYLVIDRTGNAR